MHICCGHADPLALSSATLTTQQMIIKGILTIRTISPFVKAALFRKLIRGCECIFSDRGGQSAALEGNISGTQSP